MISRDNQLEAYAVLVNAKGQHMPLCCLPLDSEQETWINDNSTSAWDGANDQGEEADILEELHAVLYPSGSVSHSVGPQPSAVRVWQMLVDNWRATGRTLPVDSAARKEIPIESGANQYWPAALVCLAAWSKFNNNKHNPGEPLHHSRAKSGDHEECIARHGIDIADARLRGDDLTELEEAAAVAWRANIRLQILCERLGAPAAPAARFTEVQK